MPSKVSALLLSILILVSSAVGASKGHPRPDSDIEFKVLHNFSGGSDGGCIYGGLARDRKGSLYGVTYCDNNGSGDGRLFKLTRTERGYTFRVLEDFSQATGRECVTTPVIDKSGNLFGVCRAGGGPDWGTLWEYTCSGKFIVLHYFGGPLDGMGPEDSVVLDSSGNIYGTAYTWGPGGAGTLWKYSRHCGVFTVLHGFSNGDDGGLLPAGPTIDQTGMIWGTTEFGPNCYYCGDGTVWNYDPSSGTFSTVLDFNSTGILAPQSKLAVDKKGNLFGTAFGTSGGQDNCGLVYELRKDENYAPTVVYQFHASNGDGCLPWGRVVLDREGNLLGVTGSGGSGNGIVYELKRENDGWQETILHTLSFNDGCESSSGLVTDDHCTWFGTATWCGKSKWGTAFEISGVL